MKYKNKYGIQLSYEGHENDMSVQLLKEVLREAIRIGDSNVNAWPKVRKFIVENFSLDFKSRYED